MKQIFTDIRYDTILAALPRQMQPYIRLARFDRPTGIWLLFLPCLFSLLLAAGQVPQIFHIDLFILFFAGAVVMRAAGCVINDLWDRRLDAKVERTALRPLPSGEVGLVQATLFLLVLLLIGLAILLWLNQKTIYLGFAAMILVVAYPLMKRITYWPQLFLGLTFNFGVLMAWTAATDTWPALSVWFLYGGCIGWTIFYDTLYAFQDIEDDMRIGVKSTAQICKDYPYALLIPMAVGAVLFWGLAGAFYWAFLPALHMAYILYKWRADSQALSLWAFQQARYTGLLLAISIVLGQF